MDIPIVINTNNKLPQLEQLWKKIRQDLQSGFRVKSSFGNQVIRVYTKNTYTNWRFLIVSSANNTMPPVFNVTINVYAQDKQAWSLSLQHTPLPQSSWNFQWQDLTTNEELKEVSSDWQNSIINAYLQSEIDHNATKLAYKRVNYTPQMAQWLNDTNSK